MSLPARLTSCTYEAGVDEAGRGALAGPVVAAAVILPRRYKHPHINDSKQLTALQRKELRAEILRQALAWCIGILSVEDIDRYNIYHAAHKAMHQAIDGLPIPPEHVVVDGNRFTPHSVPSTCVIAGDAKYLHIAAASILAKSYRDDLMCTLAGQHSVYRWHENKGYATAAHRAALQQHGLSPWHRKSFTCLPADKLVELEVQE